MAWNLVLQDTFTGRTVPTTANAAGGTNVGAPDTIGSGAWIDQNGGVYSIQTSGKLQCVCDSADASQFFRDFLKRPSGEASQDQRVVAQIPAQVTTNTTFGIALRQQSTNKCYFFGTSPSQVLGGGPQGILFKNGSAGLAQLGTGFNFTYNAAHAYQIDMSATGVNPTTITCILTDITAGTVLGTITQTDSDTALQNATGVPSMLVWSDPAATTSLIGVFSEVQIFNTAAVTIALSTSNCVLSPYTFTSSLKSVNEGAYIKTNFTNGSTANVLLNVDTSLFVNITDNEKPYLEWSIDNGPLQKMQLTTVNTVGGFITLATALAAATHTLQIIYRSCTPFQDHWTPVVNFTPQSISVSTGTLSLSQPTALPNLAAFFGDSIGAGEGTEGLVQSSSHSSYAINSDALHGWVSAVAAALNSEYAQIGFGGQGWNGGAADGVTPAFPNTWNLLSNGQARSFSTPPKYVFINHGTNGNTCGSAGTVAAVLSAMRAAFGASTKIFLMVPFNGSCIATTPSLLSEFQSYQGGSANVTSVTSDGITVYCGASDSNAFLLNMGSQAQIGLVLPAATNTAGSISSYDTTHPSAFGSLSLAGLTVRAMQLAIGAQTSSSGSTKPIIYRMSL